jgi:hypothetical protein
MVIVAPMEQECAGLMSLMAEAYRASGASTGQHQQSALDAKGPSLKPHRARRWPRR